MISMNAPEKYGKGSFIEKVAEGICTGIAAALCIIWGLVLFVLYLLILIVLNCVRLFDREE